jgi:hypothetical protein
MSSQSEIVNQLEESKVQQQSEEVVSLAPLMMAYDVMKDVKDFSSIKTSSKFLYLHDLEYVIEGNEALNGFEGQDVK